MTDQTQQPTQISEKVTTVLLDRMYNNFVKITDWMMKGKESKYPMPKALASLFDTNERNQSEITELKQLVTTLQQNLIEKEQRLTAMDSTLQGVNATLKQVIETVSNAPQQPPVADTTPEPAPQPTIIPVDDELVDLDDVADSAVPLQQASPNEQAIQVSAEAINVGNLDPVSYAALDAEINNILA